MNTKPLNDVNFELYRKLMHIRKIFYYILRLLINEEYINNNNCKNSIISQINNLENVSQSINENLIIFNDNQDKIDSISDAYFNSLIKNFKDNIFNNSINNQNYKNVDFEVIIKALSRKLKIFDINFFYNEYILPFNIKLECNLYKAIKRNPKENNQIQNLKIDEEELKNYIKQNGFKNLVFKIVNEDKKVDDVEIVKYIEFHLKNFIITLIPTRPNNIMPLTFDIKSKFLSFNNTLLRRKILTELSSSIDALIKNNIIRENNYNNLVKNLINYIHDLDKIFYIKCYGCKRNSKYSYIEKFFYPPYIKYNIEKYYNLKYPTNDKDILFFHPQCID